MQMKQIMKEWRTFLNENRSESPQWWQNQWSIFTDNLRNLYPEIYNSGIIEQAILHAKNKSLNPGNQSYWLNVLSFIKNQHPSEYEKCKLGTDLTGNFLASSSEQPTRAKEHVPSKKEFYHGTTHPYESFLGGIKTSISGKHAAGQGAGFYLFSNKEKAIRHTQDLISGDLTYQDASDVGNSEGKIIVIDAPLSPENFDIDYEGMSGMFIDYIFENPDLFVGTAAYYPSRNRTYIIKRINPKYGTISLRDENNKNPFSIRGATADSAPFIYDIARQFQEKHPDMFRQFETRALPKATALKYNGTQTIYPSRVEDLNGNVLWQRN